MIEKKIKFIDIENIPQKIKDKVIECKKEIEEIKLINNKEDLKKYENFI